MRPEIQLEIVWSAPPLTEGTRQVQLMRPYEVAGRSDIEVPLVTIDIRPQRGRLRKRKIKHAKPVAAVVAA